MCTGIALAVSELPLELIEPFQLEKRTFDRGGEKEVRFLFRAAERLLPVWHEGQLRLVRWGCRRGETKGLPTTGWTWLASVENGLWSGFEAALVDIPASMGLENGIWFRVRQGMRGVLVQDESGEPVVYMLCEPASHYYRIMTRSDRMPVLIGERI
jgi:hypothetical protein